MLTRSERLCIGAMLIALIGFIGCANQKPSVSAIEVGLCKARAAFRVAEIADSSLAPAPGTLRSKIEDAEDAFCSAQ